MTCEAANVDLVSLALRMTREGEGGLAGHARRAFDLAHRARRLCEAAAEAASRDRWTSLDAPGQPLSEPAARLAHACANTVIKYPVRTEAGVYAALLDAADCAYSVSECLYNAWLRIQPKVAASNKPGCSRDRLGSPPAPGSRWVRLPRPDEEEGG